MVWSEKGSAHNDIRQTQDGLLLWIFDDIADILQWVLSYKYMFCFASLVVSMGVSAVREGRPYHVFVFNNLYASFFQAILATAA